MIPASPEIVGLHANGPLRALRTQVIGYLATCNRAVPRGDLEAVVDRELEAIRQGHPEFDSLAGAMMTLCLFIVPLFGYGTVAQYLEVLLCAARAPFMAERAKVANSVREHLLEASAGGSVQ